MFRLTNSELPTIARPQPKSAIANFIGSPPLPNSPVCRIFYLSRFQSVPVETEIPPVTSITPLYFLETTNLLRGSGLLKVIPYQVAPETYWQSDTGYFFCTNQSITTVQVEASFNLPPLNFDSVEVQINLPSELAVSDIHYRGTRLGFAQIGTSLTVDVCDLCCPSVGIITVTAFCELDVDLVKVGDIYLFNIASRLGSIRAVEWRRQTFVRSSKLEMKKSEFHWDWRNNQLKLLV